MPQSPLTQAEIEQLQNQLETELNNESWVLQQMSTSSAPVQPVQLSQSFGPQSQDQPLVVKQRDNPIYNPQWIKSPISSPQWTTKT